MLPLLFNAVFDMKEPQPQRPKIQFEKLRSNPFMHQIRKGEIIKKKYITVLQWD